MDPLTNMFLKPSTDVIVLENCDVAADGEPQKPSAEDLLRENIIKANTLLDMALESSKAEGLTSLWVERIAKLIDSITLAAEKIIGAGAGFMDLEIKRDLVTLKSRELELRAVPGGGIKTLTQNVFNMTREDALKLLAESREPQE